MIDDERIKEALDEKSEGFIALAMLGADFRHHAVANLLTIHQCWSETRKWMLYSALTRQDKHTARMYLRDWKAQDRLPKIRISKFTPGAHYHVLNTKFTSLEEALDYLHKRGYAYGGLNEVFVYPKTGD